MADALRTGQLVVRRLRGILDSGQVGIVIGRPDTRQAYVMWTTGSGPIFDVHLVDLLVCIDPVTHEEVARSWRLSS